MAEQFQDNPMKVGFTGTREGLTKHQREILSSLFLQSKRITELHHGDCTGADEQAHFLALARGTIKVVVHPPDDDKYRAFASETQRVFPLVCIEVREPKPYLERNRDIVDETEKLIACPIGVVEKLRSGTWSTVRYALKQNKRVFVIYPAPEQGVEWYKRSQL